MNLFFRVIIDYRPTFNYVKKKYVNLSISTQYLFLQHRHESNSNLLNPNKAGLSQGSFFGGVGGSSIVN